MAMPSLFKYFAFVGGALLGLLSLTNFLLDPSTGATVVSQQSQAKPAVVTVQHDPRASRIERWRNEQAALKSSEPATTTAAKSVSQPAPAAPQPVAAAVSTPAQPAVAQASAAPVAATPVAAMPVAEAPVVAPVMASTDDAVRAERRKAAAKAAKKARIARERARTEQPAQVATGGFYGGFQQRNASNQQDQYYYGQRALPQQRQSYNAYMPRPSYGPFGGW